MPFATIEGIRIHHAIDGNGTPLLMFAPGGFRSVMSRWTAAGGKEAMFAAYTPKEKDYSALVSRMKQAGISVIYVGGYHTESALIIRQAKEQGMKATLVGGDALVTNEFWQISGASGEGTLMTFGPDPTKRPDAADVLKKFEAKKINPETYTLYSYAAVQIIKQAAEKAGTLDTKKVAEAIHSGMTFQTVLGKLSFDKKGDRTDADYVMYVWKKGADGKMSFVEM